MEDFDFDEFSACVLKFIGNMQMDGSDVRFRYSATCQIATLYASAYACMTYSLLGHLKKLSDAKRQEWMRYFDSYQSPVDGLFHDPAVMNDMFMDSDWWGSRHLALHMISAYTDLGGKPRYPFKFLSPYYDLDRVKNWLNGQDWENTSIGLGDVDNKIMNICSLLQYQRDTWGDSAAGHVIEYFKKYLLRKINPTTGLWGSFDTTNPDQRSRMVQFSYHIFPLFFYDGYFDFDHDKIVEQVLLTQNKIGGYGVRLNSSACEDIDSIDLLMRLSPYVSARFLPRMESSISKAFTWVCLNQMEDGGLVFRLNEPMSYGHRQMSSSANSGAMFPTWFRVLSIAQIQRGICNRFLINRTPGLVY